MDPLQQLEQSVSSFTGMSAGAFALSLPYWREQQYDKGEFFNEYKNVCKHLGFVMEGVFRTYYISEADAAEQNVFFYSPGHMVTAYKSFVDQAPCNYYTAALQPSRILYIHIERLRELYQASHEWERFGRLVAEKAFSMALGRAEAAMFRSPEARYLELLEQHPDIFNAVPLYHIASFLGIQGPSLSRIRKRMASH